MNDLLWTEFSMGIFVILAGIMSFVYGLLSTIGLIILVVFGGASVVFSGMPIWKAIYRRIRRKI